MVTVASIRSLLVYPDRGAGSPTSTDRIFLAESRLTSRLFGPMFRRICSPRGVVKLGQELL
jgi:hypothetical protein